MCNLERLSHTIGVFLIKSWPLFHSLLGTKIENWLPDLSHYCKPSGTYCFKNDHSGWWGFSHFALLCSEDIIRNLWDYLIYYLYITVPLESWQNWKCLDEEEKMKKWISEHQWPSVLLLAFLVVYSRRAGPASADVWWPNVGVHIPQIQLF